MVAFWICRRKAIGYLSIEVYRDGLFGESNYQSLFSIYISGSSFLVKFLLELCFPVSGCLNLTFHSGITFAQVAYIVLIAIVA